MTKKELANKFLEIDIEALNYIESITLDYKRCLRDDHDYDEMTSRIYSALTEIENLKTDYEESLQYEEGNEVSDTLVNYALMSITDYELLDLSNDELRQIKHNCEDLMGLADVELVINKTLTKLGYSFNSKNFKWVKQGGYHD